MNRTLKRLVVATFASAVATVPLALPAQADTGALAQSQSASYPTQHIDWE